MAVSRLLRLLQPAVSFTKRLQTRCPLIGLPLQTRTRHLSVELLCDAKAELGGGPFYEQESNQLLWVDKKGKSINFLDVETGKNQAIKMADRIGAVIPINQSNELVILTSKRVIVADRESGALVKDLTTIDGLEEKADVHLDAAKCDRLGRVWLSTAQTTFGTVGSLYSFGAVSSRLLRHKTAMDITNGVDWDDKFTQMFCTNSTNKKIYSFDYDESTAEISRQKVLVDYDCNGTRGHPAGMCKDRDGNLWVAGYLGSNVTCWDPSTGKAIAQVEVPVKEVTSCCFGGPSYNWLFITTARMNSDKKELEECPLSGGVFVAKDVGTGGERGYKAHLKPIKLTLGQ